MPQQRDAWRRIVDFVHAQSAAKFCLQIGHSGRKGSTQLGWERMDYPLAAGNWPLLAPSALPYMAGVSQVPRAMTRADMDAVREEFVRIRAARPAKRASTCWSCTWPTATCSAAFCRRSRIAVRMNTAATSPRGCDFPWKSSAPCARCGRAQRPLSARISACDWAQGGLSEEDLLAIAAALKQAGADVLDVSTGQTVADQQPVYGRMWQTPFADKVRNEIGIPDHCGGQYIRGGSCEFHHRGGPGGSMRTGAAAFVESRLDAERRGGTADSASSAGPIPISRASPSSSEISSARPRHCRRPRLSLA